jgi:hypothetical protein
MVIARGAAFNETGFVGVLLALGGFAIWGVALWDNRRRLRVS